VGEGRVCREWVLLHILGFDGMKSSHRVNVLAKIDFFLFFDITAVRGNGYKPINSIRSG
jgi:hypothetical protein